MSTSTIEPAVDVPSGAVIVGVDGSAGSERAVLWGVEQARREHRPLVLVHALSPTAVSTWMSEPGFDQSLVLGAFRDAGRADLDQAKAMVHDHAPELEVHEFYAEHDPRDTLLELSRRASMVVLGSQGRGSLTSMVLGSVSRGVALHADCPVVVLRPASDTRKPPPDRAIVVGVDGTEGSASALEFAYRQASLRDLPLTVLHVYWEQQRTGYPSLAYPLDDANHEDIAVLLAESIAGMAEKFPDVETHLRSERGLPATELVAASRDAEMVVVGIHPRHPLHDLLTGETSREMLGRACGAIAVVPDPA